MLNLDQLLAWYIYDRKGEYEDSPEGMQSLLESFRKEDLDDLINEYWEAIEPDETIAISDHESRNKRKE